MTVAVKEKAKNIVKVLDDEHKVIGDELKLVKQIHSELDIEIEEFRAEERILEYLSFILTANEKHIKSIEQAISNYVRTNTPADLRYYSRVQNDVVALKLNQKKVWRVYNLFMNAQEKENRHIKSKKNEDIRLNELIKKQLKKSTDIIYEFDEFKKTLTPPN